VKRPEQNPKLFHSDESAVNGCTPLPAEDGLRPRAATIFRRGYNRFAAELRQLREVAGMVSGFEPDRAEQEGGQVVAAALVDDAGRFRRAPRPHILEPRDRRRLAFA
jgi:hypothetical protein